jgi:PAS domain S-box-containing protein
MNGRVAAFIAGLLGVAGICLAIDLTRLHNHGSPDWWSAIPFVALLATAEYLMIRFRYRDEVNAINLFDAALAPMLVGVPIGLTIVLVAVAQGMVAVVRRNERTKAAFNIAQWVSAAALGRLVLDTIRRGDAVSGRTMAGLLLAMLAVGIYNQLAFTIVVGLAERWPLRKVLSGFAPVIVPGWVAGWVVNTTFGMLFVTAYAGSHKSVIVFFVPLLVLHFAYRGYASARADRARTSGMHRSLQALGIPIDPRDAIPPFLAEVGRMFGARAVDLTLVDDGSLVVHRVTAGDASTHERRLSVRPLRHQTSRLTDDELEAEGWRDGIAAPLLAGERVIGMLSVYDQSGLEGLEDGDVSVVETLAREAAGTFQKAGLLQAIFEERRKLGEIVTHASDGILTLATDGTIGSWNPELERVTGWTAAEMIGRRNLWLLQAVDLSGTEAALDDWARNGRRLPAEVQVRTRSGDTRWLSCSYSPVTDGDGRDATLIVIARDTTRSREMEALKEEVGRLAELEAAQREVVSQLQEAVRPPMPIVAGAELGVCYLPSDPIAPTGGDLYDWQVLPDGEVHLAIVDVLGKGVAATKDALTVTHALRLLALEGCPLGDLVRRTDQLLAAQAAELVATVLIVRYSPATGALRLAGAGHPPALAIRGDGSTVELFAEGIPIGWPGAGSLEVVEHVLDVDESLLLYTDGLVEATKDIIAGLAALQRAASECAALPARKLARVLVDRSLAGAVRRDDSVALVMRRRTGTAADRMLELRLAPATASAHDARRQVTEWLDDYPAAAADRDDLVLVASELVTNALTVAHSEVVIRVIATPGAVTIEVEDDGPGFAFDPAILGTQPSPDAERGRGLFLVGSLVDRLHIDTDHDGSVVQTARTLGVRVPTSVPTS